MKALTTVLLVLAGCGPRYAPRPSGDWAMLNRTPTLFMRLFGGGPLAPPPAPVTYELCYDFAQNKIVEVHDAATGRNVAATVADVFLASAWSRRSRAGCLLHRKCRRVPSTNSSSRSDLSACQFLPRANVRG